MTTGLVLNSEVLGAETPGVLPVVVMHGWANSIQEVRPLASQLANFTLVHVLDLPGHGKSPVPPESWGMGDFALCLKGYLDSKGLSRVHLVGHSFGGKTAIRFTAEFPEYVDKIVLIGASGIRPRPDLKKKLRNLFLKFLRNFIRFRNTELGARIYREWYIPRFASRDYLNAGPMTRIFVRTVNEELHRELSRIDKKSLLIWGENDDESPLSVGEEMARLMKNSTLVGIPNQGHYPFIGSSAPLVFKYIRDFLFR